VFVPSLKKKQWEGAGGGLLFQRDGRNFSQPLISPSMAWVKVKLPMRAGRVHWEKFVDITVDSSLAHYNQMLPENVQAGVSFGKE
jgi:hypothetical protein